MAVKEVPARPVTARAVDGGPVTRAIQDVTGAAEALTVGAVNLTRHTLTAAVETVEDVGGEVGALSRRTVKATVQVTREIGGELGSLAVDAVEGAVLAVDRIGSAAGRSLRDALAGTVAGVKTVLAEAGMTGLVPRRPPAPAPEPARRPLARVTRSKRSVPARKSA